MSKILTLRLEDSIYELLRNAAEGESRTISNFIKYAAVNYTMNEIFITDAEMDALKPIIPSLRKGLNEAKEGNYFIIG